MLKCHSVDLFVYTKVGKSRVGLRDAASKWLITALVSTLYYNFSVYYI